MRSNKNKTRSSLISISKDLYGFTLIELLVVISIIAVLIAISVFGIQNARKSSRDARRKADLESIRSGLELYRADCGSYPTNDILSDTSLVGSGVSSCTSSNVYIKEIPRDPLPTQSYYYSATSTSYSLCAILETETTSVACGSCSGCTYKVTNP